MSWAGGRFSVDYYVSSSRTRYIYMAFTWYMQLINVSPVLYQPVLYHCTVSTRSVGNIVKLINIGKVRA